MKVRILQFLTSFTQLTAKLKSFLMGWLLVLGLKEGLFECATVCIKSEVCSRCRNVNAPSVLTFHDFISIFPDQNKASLFHHLFLHPEFHLHRDVLGKKPKKKLRGVSLRRFETHKKFRPIRKQGLEIWIDLRILHGGALCQLPFRWIY